MKPWVRTHFEESSYDYPDEMNLILGYLSKNGELKVSGRIIERLYREFSDSRYCAGWMSVDNCLLSEFADYLEEYEL